MRSAEVPGYNGRYIVFEDGTVLSKARYGFGKPLKASKGTTGYMRVELQLDKEKDKKKMFKIHRLLATTFIPNPGNLPDVNHIDGNPLNNALSNLEWCTTSHNIKHAVKLGRIKTKTVYQKNGEGEIVRIFNSLTEVAEAGFQKSNVSNCCHGKRDMAHGFYWDYAK